MGNAVLLAPPGNTDVENMTHKTGNFKRFAVFHKMLVTALTKDSSSVYVDLLTFADVERLRHEKEVRSPFDIAVDQHYFVHSLTTGWEQGSSRAAPSRPGSNPQQQQSKRYMILTYTVEYDRVHYPLPLLFDEHPDPNRLKASIRQVCLCVCVWLLRVIITFCSHNDCLTNPGALNPSGIPSPLLLSLPAFSPHGM